MYTFVETLMSILYCTGKSNDYKRIHRKISI